MADIPLKIVFMGTPDFSAPALTNLIDNPAYDVAAVYTQPPRPKGRGQKMQLSPIHQIAESHKIPVYTPHSLKKDMDAVSELATINPDVIVVAAYGLILPKAVLEIPPYGCLNIHASLLPRWRGAAPIQYAIWHGDKESGITIMQMEEGLDTGPMISKKSVTIRQQTTAQSLHDELAALGSGMIEDVLDQIRLHGAPETKPQDENQATYAPMLKKEDGRVDWSLPAADIDCQIRALNPWPGVWALNNTGKRIKILSAEPVSEAFSGTPGTLIDSIGHIICGRDTALRLLKVQPENAKAMDAVSAINGGYLKPDMQLG